MGLLIPLMPLFATAPLAVGAIVVVGLVVSPRIRDACSAWVERRLGGGPSRTDEVAALRQAVSDLTIEVARSRERVAFMERHVAGQGVLPPGVPRPALRPEER